MQKIPFHGIPFWLKLGVGLTFFNTWVLFAELVIDRYGLWVYMPLYQVAHPCIWDVFVAVSLIAGFWRASHISQARTVVA